MKKVFIGIILFIIFIFIYFLESSFFPFFTIAGIIPNLFVIFILFVGLFANSPLAIGLAVLGGIIIDSVNSPFIGGTAIMLTIIAFLASYFDRNFSKDNRITIILMVAGATIIYEIGIYIIRYAIIGFDIEIVPFIKILVIEVLYNVLISINIYPLMQKAGYSIDRVFKKNNMLTRYF